MTSSLNTKLTEDIQHQKAASTTPAPKLNNSETLAAQLASLSEPEDELVFTARRKITLQCGQSSITLHANGKIVLRGDYIVSAAEGTNRIVGGQIEIN